MQVTLSREELVGELRQSVAEAAERLRALPAAVYTEGRYESDWDGHAILAHVASVEWTYPKLIDLARLSASPMAETAQAAAASFDAGSYNQRHVEKRRDTPVEELVQELERNRAATIAAVEGADDELLAREITSAGGVQGPLAQVLRYLCVEHLRHHVDDLAGGAG